jgi:hypothetical protein
MNDPRPDLAYDSPDWTRLLNLAESKDLLLAGILLGFRCFGLRLHHGAKGWALRPELDPKTSEWLSDEQYIKDRDKWLMPYQKEICELLGRLNG